MEINKVFNIIEEMKEKIGTDGNGRRMYPTWQDESYADAVNSFAFDLKKKINDSLNVEGDIK
jgi:hypothetical protein